MSTLMPYLLVGIGGFIGANARFILASGVSGMFGVRFPIATFVVNVTGSFLLGVLGTIVTQKATPGSDAMRLALGVGFLGAFTTFSTFEFETNALLESDLGLAAAMNIFASVFIGLAALRAGILVARNLLP